MGISNSKYIQLIKTKIFNIKFNPKILKDIRYNRIIYNDLTIKCRVRR